MALLNRCRRLLPASKKDFESPSFIFAASWRTGSTLLRRVVNGSGRTSIREETAFLPEARNLFERTSSYLERVKSNRESAYQNVIGRWIPVVSLEPDRANVATRSFFEWLYVAEARAQGFKRRDFKEVTGEADPNMRFRVALWPKAHLLFRVRDPYDACRSVKGKKFHANSKEPMKPVQVWNENVTAFLDSTDLDGRCLLVRYEELVRQSRTADGLLRAIAEHLNCEVNQRMFREPEARTDLPVQSVELTADERAEIAGMAGAAAQRLGYRLH